MSVFLVLVILALVCFGLAAINVATAVNLVALGAALLTITLLLGAPLTLSVYTVLVIVALVCFLVATLQMIVTPVNLVALGFALLTVTLLLGERATAAS